MLTMAPPRIRMTNLHHQFIPSWIQTLTIWIVSSTWIIHANHDAKRLYDDLLRKNNYNKLIRPVGNTSEKLVIKLGVKLSQVIDVDEKNEILALNMWVQQEWEDYSLRWIPDEYGGVEMLYVPSELIWLPDIVLYNNADGDYTVTLMTKATIWYHGGVKWEPPAIFKSYCKIDVEYFPFDQQDCVLKFGSWTYDGFQVDVKHFWHEKHGLKHEEALVDPGIDLKAYYPSIEWDLMQVSAKKNIIRYPCCDEPYPDVSFYLQLRRKTLFYTLNLIIPCISITMLTVLGFYLPSDCGEKISLCISLLLSLSLFQLLLLEIIPPTSLKVPLIGKYILFTTVLVTVSVLSSVIILNINFRTDTTHKMPVWMKRLFIEFLPKFLLMKRPVVKNEHDEELDFDWATSELSNYENPYKSKLKPLPKLQRLRTQEPCSTENLYSSVNSTFIGVDGNDLDVFCQACQYQRHRPMELPANAVKALEGVPYIAKHMKDYDAGTKVKQEWRYMALVVDRILLWIYVGVCGFSTIAILMNAPALYDRKIPLTGSVI